MWVGLIHSVEELTDLFLCFFFFFFWPCHLACGILVPRPGIKPVAPAVEARSPNHWTTTEFLPDFYLPNLHNCVTQFLKINKHLVGSVSLENPNMDFGTEKRGTALTNA